MVSVKGGTNTLPESMDIGKLLPVLSGDGWRAEVREWLYWVLGVYETCALFGKGRDEQEGGGENVFLHVLRERELALDGGEWMDRIPKKGRGIVVANHPFGGADAIALAGICAKVRPDCKIMANAMSSDLPGTKRWTIPLQIMGEEGAAASNREAMVAALKLLREDGLLVVFPAGAVSRWQSKYGRVTDPEWSSHIARLATKTRSPVLPVRFFGRNPGWFEILGAIHPMLRAVLVVRVFLAAKGRSVKFRAGNMIPASALDGLDAVEATKVMREAVESIREP